MVTTFYSMKPCSESTRRTLEPHKIKSKMAMRETETQSRPTPGVLSRDACLGVQRNIFFSLLKVSIVRFACKSHSWRRQTHRASLPQLQWCRKNRIKQFFSHLSWLVFYGTRFHDFMHALRIVNITGSLFRGTCTWCMCRILKALFSAFNVDGSFIVFAYVAHISFTATRDRLVQVVTPQKGLEWM